jgi:hypothetical protein
MPFPAVIYTRDADAANAMVSNAAQKGLPLDGSLSQIGAIASVVANLLQNDPANSVNAADLTGATLAANVLASSLTSVGTLSAGAVPASLVTAGTFGAGAYTFPSTLAVTGTTTLTGAVSFGTNPSTVGQLNVPNGGALAARNAANSANINLIYLNGTNVTVVGDGNAVSVPGTFAVTGATALGGSAVASGVVIDGTGFGAATASLRFNGLTNGAAAAAGTLANSPVVGNPTFWMPVNIAGVVKYIPCW